MFKIVYRCLPALMAIALAQTSPAALAAPAQTEGISTVGTANQAKAKPAPAKKSRLDHTGRRQIGNASYYSSRFNGRKMANGERMHPNSNAAASRTLPLGTTARVTNLENGRSAVVVIKDRGPFVGGRIVDVSRGTARQLDMIDDGVVRVEVRPIELPS